MRDCSFIQLKSCPHFQGSTSSWTLPPSLSLGFKNSLHERRFRSANHAAACCSYWYRPKPVVEGVWVVIAVCLMLFAKGKGMAEYLEMLTCLAATKAIFAFYGQCGNRLTEWQISKGHILGVLLSIHMQATNIVILPVLKLSMIIIRICCSNA